MKTRWGMGLAAACAACAVASGDVMPLAETDSAVVYAVDSRLSPRTVKTAEALSQLTEWGITRCSGEKVTLTAPDGTKTTLAESSAAETSLVFPSLGSGGQWTLTNSKQGSVTFSVRYSGGAGGAGTVASPAKLVDFEDLVDRGAGNGYTFTVEGDENLFAALKVPAGYRVEKIGDGVWQLVTSSDGSECFWAEYVYRADSRLEGPDRKSRSDTVPPVAYSGDDWEGDASKAATLTFVAPDGTETVLNRTGTGVENFVFDRTGVWTVTLEANGATSTAELFLRDLFMISFK